MRIHRESAAYSENRLGDRLGCAGAACLSARNYLLSFFLSGFSPPRFATRNATRDAPFLLPSHSPPPYLYLSPSREGHADSAIVTFAPAPLIPRPPPPPSPLSLFTLLRCVVLTCSSYASTRLVLQVTNLSPLHSPPPPLFLLRQGRDIALSLNQKLSLEYDRSRSTGRSAVS